jgi:hypothetical protein
MFLPIPQAKMPGSEANNFGGALFQATRVCYPETPYYVLELRIIDAEQRNAFTNQPGKWWCQYQFWQAESSVHLLTDDLVIAHRLHVVLPAGIGNSEAIKMMQVSKVLHVKNRSLNGIEFNASVFIALDGSAFVFCEDVPISAITPEHIQAGQVIYDRNQYPQNLE